MLAEIKIISYLLFGSVVLFVLALAYMLAKDGFTYNPDTKPFGYYKFHWNLDLIAAFSIFLCAYNFSFIEFPLYHALGSDRSKAKMLKAVGLGMIETVIIYVSCGILAVYLFGSSTSDNILNNICEQTSFLSYFIRAAFLILLACHIPYVFFLGKEGACIVVDEIMT